jgi:hypothetical protein
VPIPSAEVDENDILNILTKLAPGTFGIFCTKDTFHGDFVIQPTGA